LADKVRELFAMADEAYQRGQAGGDAMDYAAFEERVSRATADLECAVHQTVLGSLDIDAPFVRVWGKSYRRVHRTERAYGTMAGAVPVTRTLYRELGKRSGPVLDPVAMRAGVVDGSWLPRTARAMSHLLALGTSREASATCKELLRLPYCRSSFERVGHAVGAEYLRRREPVESHLIERFELPEEARSISVSVDRTSVPMEEPVQPARAPAEAVRLTRPRAGWTGHGERDKAALEEQQRQIVEAKTPKIERNWRMAYCATVTLHDATGQALHTIRYGRMPPTPGSVESVRHREVKRMMERLQQDVVALRAQRPDLPVVLLADGAPELWNLFDRYLNEQTLGVVPIKLIDAWHALEYVGAAARFLESRQRAWPGSFVRWKRWLLTEPDGVGRVLRALGDAGLHEARDESGVRPVGDAIRYLHTRISQMRYAEAQSLGLPIGSGAVEATCKSLVAQRMKRPGSRWKPTTGNEVLQLRALQLSDRWDQAMKRVLRPLRKPVHVLTREQALGRAA
jgi:hypothetical protein